MDDKDYKILELEAMLWKDRYNKAINVITGVKFYHKFLGPVVITEQCMQLQVKNPDPSTIFVEFEGEVREVTKNLLTMI